MRAETWGCLAEPPATVTHLRRRRLIRTYRRHREAVQISRFIVALRDVQEVQRQRALEKTNKEK